MERINLPVVAGKKDLAIFYSAMKGRSIDEIAAEAENVSQRVHVSEVVERLETYRDRGLLDKDYMPNHRGREVRDWVEQDMNLMSMDRLGEVYDVLNQVHAVEVLEAVKEDRYDELLEEDYVFPGHAEAALERLEEADLLEDGDLTDTGLLVYSEIK